LNPTAEEYYKNDYPDEESSDYDASEGSDGASSSVPCYWKQLCVHIDLVHDDFGEQMIMIGAEPRLFFGRGEDNVGPGSPCVRSIYLHAIHVT